MIKDSEESNKIAISALLIATSVGILQLIPDNQKIELFSTEFFLKASSNAFLSFPLLFFLGYLLTLGVYYINKDKKIQKIYLFFYRYGILTSFIMILYLVLISLWIWISIKINNSDLTRILFPFFFLIPVNLWAYLTFTKKEYYKKNTGLGFLLYLLTCIIFIVLMYYL
jgi:hypothetical protein